MSLPASVSLPSLKVLEFRNFVFLDGSLFDLILRCPALKDLSIFECEFPNTTMLTFEAPSLERLVLNWDDVVMELAADLDKSMEIIAHFLRYFDYTDRIASRGYKLSNMAYLEETHIRIHYAQSIPFVVDQEVKVKSLALHTAQVVPPCLSCNIEEIKISFYKTKIQEQLIVATYFLRHGLHLQKLVVNIDVEDQDSFELVVVEYYQGLPLHQDLKLGSNDQSLYSLFLSSFQSGLEGNMGNSLYMVRPDGFEDANVKLC
ncbi:hypothetical protein V6N13_117032 [Hibiscus sabdariffa]|uniref:FBD domain-containing protein n=1 Tax=Hibiscus sabdariffa TaxID=183260 RepID=A0ABR2QH30_9ROSI